MHFQQLNYTSEPKAAVFARIGRKNRDCRGGSVADGAIGLRIVTFRFFDLFRNHPLPFRARIPLLLRDTPFRRSISPLTAAVHKMLIGFPCERLRRLQKHYICIQRMTVPCRRVMRRRDEKGTPVQFRDYPRSCNFHDKGRTISATAARNEAEDLPSSLRSELSGRRARRCDLPCGDYLPVPARSLSYRIHSRNTAAEIALSDRDRSRSIRARRKRRRGRFDRDCRHEGRRGDSP